MSQRERERGRGETVKEGKRSGRKKEEEVVATRAGARNGAHERSRVKE